MIPRKIEVEGFLCYRDRQVVDLDGSDLWVFSGRNGSGKSTIFDAITFALFGVHRGGKQGLENLINAESSEFRIVFDFDLDDDRFRIARGSTRRGGTATRQLFRREFAGPGGEEWLPVAETDKQAGFDRWVESNVGLRYELFTSSMMLRQGEGEKLLEASPKHRFEIVAEVADLRSYQRLHEKAEARRKERKARQDAIRADLAGRPVVEPAAIEDAEGRLSEAERARAEASADRDRLAGIEALAKRWREIAEDRDQAYAEAGRARGVIESSEAIEADWQRLGELDRMLPALLDEAGRRAEVARLEAAGPDRRAKRGVASQKLDDLAKLADQARACLAEADREIAEDQARRSAIPDLQAALAAPIHRVRAAALQWRTLAAIEEALAMHPTDLEDQVGRLAEEVSRRTEWKQALPTLENLAEAREGLGRARSKIVDGREEVALAEAESLRLGGALRIAQAEASTTRSAREEAGHRLAEIRSVERMACGRFDAFETLDGSSTCDRCGQTLTAQHYELEAHRLRTDRDEARRALEDLEQSLRDAETRDEAAQSGCLETDRLGRRAEAALAESRGELSLAAAELAGHQAACVKSFDALDESFRSAVATGPVVDWTMTTFPTPSDIAEGRRLREGLARAERLAQDARSRFGELRDLRSRLAEARRGFDAVGLQPGDEQAEVEDARLAEEAAALDRCLKSHRLEQASAEEAIDDLSKKMEVAHREIATIDSGRATDLALIEASRKASSLARESVPGPWLAAFDRSTRADLDSWESERDSLRSRGVEQLAAEVPKAQWALKSAEDRIAGFDARLAEIPEDARRDPGTIARSKGLATARLDKAEEEARIRQRTLDALRRDRDDRAALEARSLEADRSLAVSTVLAELLGRGSLQRALIRDAERGILDCANPILRDVSGGDLELRLSAGELGDDQALSLEVVDRTHGPGRTLDVAFLSGSQKFRVAVSLALGIGQYARGLDRPIQSVIIDEGFGCLDRQGRDEMIAQLTSFKGRLARVVLVSHQEEFADAFKDGYHFEARDGSTIVQEFHR